MNKIKSNFRRLFFEKQAKENRPISLRKMATETGISITTIMSWSHEENQVRYDAPTLIKLCDYFDCSLSDLLEYYPDHSS